MQLKGVVVTLLVLSLCTASLGQLEYGFYNGKCGEKDVESIIKGIVTFRFYFDQKIIAALLRMLFHDCFVHGCDASLLLTGPDSEQTAVPNFSVFGFDLIEEIKAALENECPGIVSCADIISAATRDAVVLAGGSRYDVPFGRKDGLVSLAEDVKLPSPLWSVPEVLDYYGVKGFNTEEVVLLMGGHTVGVTHCNFIKSRLYDYKGTGQPDSSLNGFYIFFLSAFICPNDPSSDNMFVFLDDPSSVLTVDNMYYKHILDNKGILPIDNYLAFDPATASIVQSYADNNQNFLEKFGEVLVKLGSVDVLTGDQGEIRKVCSRTN
ncbi:hypothetical protein LUZ60_014345 [Juncus effusus]|nr:hypothetical protein LUZ60_014345 [Juncus effusus]